MSLPNSYTSYAAEIDAFDRALSDPKGVRVFKGTREAAIHFRSRLHYARKLDRARSREVYKPGDPGYDTSVFDTIVCRLRDDTEGHWWVYLERNESVSGIVESLSEEA